MSYVRNYLLTLFLLTFFVAPMYGLLYMLPFFFTWKYFPLIPGKVNAVLQAGYIFFSNISFGFGAGFLTYIGYELVNY